MVSALYIVGILFALVATVIFNVIPVLQKDSLDKMKEISFNRLGDSVKTMFSDKKWVFGLLLGLIGGIPYTLAVNWTGISVVQPLMNFGFIVLVIFANRYLGEKLNFLSKMAIGMMILMPVFITLSDVSAPRTDITQVGTQVQLIYFLLGIIGITIISWLIAQKYPIFYTLVTGLLFAMGAYAVQFVMSMIVFSGYNLLTDIPLMISRVFEEKNIQIILIGVVGITAFNAVAGFVMQIGLQKVAASKFNPIQQTLNNIATVIGGIIVYGQFVGNWFFYLMGLSFGIIGAIVLGQYQIQSPPKPIPTPAEQE
jgi:MFS family permease